MSLEHQRPWQNARPALLFLLDHALIPQKQKGPPQPSVVMLTSDSIPLRSPRLGAGTSEPPFRPCRSPESMGGFPRNHDIFQEPLAQRVPDDASNMRGGKFMNPSTLSKSPKLRVCQHVFQQQIVIRTPGPRAWIQRKAPNKEKDGSTRPGPLCMADSHQPHLDPAAQRLVRYARSHVDDPGLKWLVTRINHFPQL